MKYKIGDKVKVKSLDWYNQNKDEFGEVKCGGYIFPYPMTKHCGKTVTIRCVNTKDRYYVIYEDDGYRSWTDEMIEGIADMEISKRNNDFMNDNEELFEKITEWLFENTTEYEIEHWGGTIEEGVKFCDFKTKYDMIDDLRKFLNIN